jgi:hypothetical protein
LRQIAHHDPIRWISSPSVSTFESEELGELEELEELGELEELE